MFKAFVLEFLFITAYAVPAQQQSSFSSSAITSALNEAVENFISEARDTALCTFVTNRLNEFSSKGVFTTEPSILLEVNEGHTIELFELLPILGGSDIAIPLESVSFDCDTFDFTVVSQPYGSQTIIPDVLELENVAFSLSMLLSNAETLTVFFGGQWTIVDDTAVEVGVQYTRETGQFDITAIPTGTRFDFVALASSLTGLTLPNPFGGSLSFDSFLISGVITADNIATMIISQKFNSPQIFIIFHKVPGENLKKAIAVEYLNFDFSSLISQLTSVDISRVPYFGSITAPGIGLTISSADISDLPADIFATTTLLISNEDGVENGIIAYLKFEFFDDPIKMTFDEILTFSPSVANLKVNDLLSAIPNVDFSSIPVPFDISEILAVDITSFSLSHEEKAAISVEVQYSNGLSFFDGFISIINADITLALSRNPTKMRVQVAGEMNIGKSSFTASLFLDDNDKYVLRASASLLPITNVISQFQAEVLPPELSSLFTDFSFSIKKPRISYPLSSVPKTIQIGGIPVFSGYKTVRMDAIILRQTSKTYLVQGYDIPGVNMADFLQDISGFSFKKIALFNQDLEVVTLISPITLPNIRLTGERLQEYSITKGVSIQAQMSFPSDCASDAFCAVAQFLLGENAMLLLHGTFQSSTNFAVFAGVSDFSVGSGLIISNAGLEVQAGTETTAGITGSIILSDPPITLTSRIFLSTSGVVLEMTQSGCWDDAFGASWLAICNIQGAIGMVPGLLVTSLEVGGEVRLGDPSCFAPIIAIGFLGIDAVTPTNNYYYVQFGVSTTVASLMNAFCVNVNLPRPLGESGFPNGFLSSFSLIGKELPHAGISILQGFRLNGTLNILGLQGSADVTINVPSGLHFSVELPPINVGNGLLRMFASRRDSSRGPFLTASITLLPSVNINIAASGYVRVLGISTEASLRITNTKYEYIISGKMLNLFQSDLVISASYGSISQASFRVRGSFRNDLYDKITKKIKDTLQASANEATDAIDKAQRRVDNEQEKFDNANRDLRAARREVNKANADFEKANKDLKSAKDHVNKVCSIKKCGSVCVPCVKGSSCCKKIFKKCVCKVPKYDKCCTKVTDPACITANEACQGLKATAKEAVSTAQGVVNGAQKSLDAAKLTLKGAEETVNAAKKSLDLAKLALKATSETYKFGAEAAQKITEVGVNGLVSIREVFFDVNLSVANGGSFAGSVRANFLGQAEIRVSLTINLRDITAMAKQLADHIGKGFSSLF